MSYFYPFLLFFVLWGLIPNRSSAQYYNPKCRYTSFGFSIKGSYFDGDIATPLQYVRPGLGASINRRVTPRITLISEFMWIRIMGDDLSGSNLQTPNKIPYYIRNLHFRNDIKELSVGVKYDLFPSLDHYRKRPIYNLYGTLGLSIFHHNPKAKIFKDSTQTGTKWVSLKTQKTENTTYSSYQLAIPLAVGIRYKLSLQWDLEVELGYRFTFTDYLDDVSGQYAHPATLTDRGKQLSNRSADTKSALTRDDRDLEYIENSLGFQVIESGNYRYVDGFGPGTARGSKKGSDRYVVFALRLLYAIPGTVNCPKFRDY